MHLIYFVFCYLLKSKSYFVIILQLQYIFCNSNTFWNFGRTAPFHNMADMGRDGKILTFKHYNI